MKPKVSIILPCRNEVRDIESCVTSLLAQQPPEGGMELIIADGMSDDGTRPILQQLATHNRMLRMVDNPGRTAACGLNAAVGVARGDIVVRMDAHTEYAPDYVCRCVDALLATGADNVGGPWVARGLTYTSRAIAAAFGCPLVVGGARGHSVAFEGQVDTVYLGCWHKAVFEKFGLFDEEMVRNQDDEFNLRISRAGGCIWQSPAIRSWYHPRNSLKALFEQYMQYGYWKVRVIQKHRLPASLRHLVPGAFVFGFFALGVASFFSGAALVLWVSIAAAYAFLNLVASISCAQQAGWTLLPILPCVVACYHFAYGYGFLHGLLDFVILRKGPHKFFTKLTRNSAAADGYAVKEPVK